MLSYLVAAIGLCVFVALIGFVCYSTGLSHGKGLPRNPDELVGKRDFYCHIPAIKLSDKGPYVAALFTRETVSKPVYYLFKDPPPYDGPLMVVRTSGGDIKLRKQAAGGRVPLSA